MMFASLNLPRKVYLPYGVQRRVARRLKLSEGYVSGVITGARPAPLTMKGKRTWAKIERAVAAELAKLDAQATDVAA